MRSPEADQVEDYIRGEAAKIAAAPPEDFVKELRLLVERVFQGTEDKSPDMLSALELPAGTAVSKVSADGVPCEWVAGANSDPAKRMLYVHGGGALAGSVATHRVLAARIAEQTGSVLLVADFSLAPEKPFPAGLNDCITAYNYLCANSPSGPGDAEKLFMAGDSAGGGIALSILANRPDQLNKIPNAVVTHSALTDFTASSNSMQDNFGKDALLSDQAIVACGMLYAGEAGPAHPEVSPMHSSVNGLPPVQMQVSSTEVLLDDSRLFMEKHLANGGEGELKVYENMVHVWLPFAPFLPEANRALEDLAEFIQRY